MQILAFCFVSCFSGNAVSAGQKAVIGETAWITIDGISVPYLARIDTGARITSIHAVDIEIENGSKLPEENVGRIITFTTADRSGNTTRISAVIKKVSTVKNSQGIEQRYVIELPLSWHHVKKTVAVNLRDRSQMSYKLLIGRNWLSSDFLVDVDIKASEQGEAK